MWTCPRCGRIFKNARQPHSCKLTSLESHFVNKSFAKDLFDHLLRRLEEEVGTCKVLSIPCCIHLFGTYDFLAVLPKRDGIEIRFALDRRLDSPRLKVCVPMSKKVFKNCFAIGSKQELDREFISWLKESYYLKS